MKTNIKLLSIVIALAFFVSSLRAQTIKGQVIDYNGNPIVGATILFDKTTGVVSDENGYFSFDRASAGKTIQISHVGYKTEEIKLGDSNSLTVTLYEDQKQLKETVITGYGKSTKEKNTGSITTITSEVLERYSGKSVLDVLQGRVAGLQIAAKNGLPGSTAKINIRGQNTIGSSYVDGCGHESCCVDPEADKQTVTEPLIIVDGIQFINQSVSSLSIGAAGATGPLATLSSSDIERIDILKDADATAIYGTRGANGVIIITTKRGLTSN
ncbi:MAG: TonB-dependent receptor plug domain-containing protein [Dysgonamonadaceae bacterium]|jgi:TonB-dependent SusC/RagA subfamily outer membrane receptor|nr:TonB-dependent receptor plug domain-containing protein [Dysgonamonadaceae bacterium]